MKQLASFAQKALNDPRLTYQVSVSLIRIISGGLGELVGPCVDDRVAINVLDTSRDALLELLFRSHPYVAQNRAGELGEEALDEIEPGAVLGREGELEAAGWSSGEPSCGFS